MRQLCMSMVIFSLFQPLCGMIEESFSSRYKNLRRLILTDNLNSLHEWFNAKPNEKRIEQCITEEQKLCNDSSLIPLLFIANWQYCEKLPLSLAEYTLETTDEDTIGEFFTQHLGHLLYTIARAGQVKRVTKIPKSMAFCLLEKDLETSSLLCEQFCKENSREIVITKNLWTNTKELPQNVLDLFVVPHEDKGDENLYVKVYQTRWENFVQLGGLIVGDGCSAAGKSLKSSIQTSIVNWLIELTPFASGSVQTFQDFNSLGRATTVGFLNGTINTLYAKRNEILQPNTTLLFPSTAVRYINTGEIRTRPLFEK